MVGTKLLNLINQSLQGVGCQIKIFYPMVDILAFKNLALSFPKTVEVPHFEKTSFRIKNKIFATLDTILQRACLKLTPVEQSVFCSIDATMIYPVNNKWGKQGWTFVELQKVKKSLLKDALSKAFFLAAKKIN